MDKETDAPESDTPETLPEKAANNIRRILSNIVAMLTSDMLNRATTFMLYALVGRYLGLFEFGQVSLALLLFYTFQVFAGAGFRMLITREVARDHSKTDMYLVNGSISVLGFSTVSLLILVFFVWAMGYDEGTANAILLISIGLPMYALSEVAEGLFQARERMHYIAYANVPANILKVAGSYYLLDTGYGVNEIVLLMVLVRLVIILIEWVCILIFITVPTMTFDFSFIRSVTRQTLPFLGIESVIAIWASLFAILLSKMTTEVEVGLYNASTQLLVPVMLVIQSMAISIYPIMCRRFEIGGEGLKNVYENVIELLLSFALPAAVGIAFLAGPLLLLFYGDESFLAGVHVLRIVVWILIPLSFTHALGQVLLASLHEDVTLRIVVINTIIGLIIGMILIHYFGLIGAAVATLLTRVIDLFQHYVPVSRLLSNISLGKMIWRPCVATTCMSLYLFFVVNTIGFWLSMISAALLYAAVLGTIMIWSDGGIQQLKARYLYLWSE